MFVLFIPFSFLVTFVDKVYENMKILCNLCLHFARKDGQDRKNENENYETKMTKIPKTKRRKYGMNKTLVTKFVGHAVSRSHETIEI